MLAYSLHSVLNGVSTSLKTGDLDPCRENISQVLFSLRIPNREGERREERSEAERREAEKSERREEERREEEKSEEDGGGEK